MVQLIPLALLALASLTSAAPIITSNEVSSLMETTMPSSFVFPLNWKRDYHGNIEFNEILESAIIQALSQDNMLMKRQSDSPFELESLFRGLFDKIVSHIIEVTPLNGIVHGNYDLLYALFTDKIAEAIAGIGQGVDQAPALDLPPFNLFGSPDQAPAPLLPPLDPFASPDQTPASLLPPFNPFGSPASTNSDVSSTPNTGAPFDIFGGLGSVAPPAIPDIFNIGKGKDNGKNGKGEKYDSDEEDDCEEDEDEEYEDEEDEDDEDEDEGDSDDDDCDEEDEEDEDDEEEDYKRKWKNHWKKHHRHHKSKMLF